MMSTPQINQKNMVPRYHGDKRLSMSRSHFLDGTIRAFFGPGQRPDSPQTYKKPGDWPPAGALLRVPQVVWLSPVAGAFPFYQFSLVAERIEIDYGAAGDITIYPDPHYVTNQNLIDYRAWQAVLAETKGRIDAIRPGRTWVHVVDWDSWDTETDSVEAPFGEFTAVGPAADWHFRYIQSEPTYLHLRSPKEDDPGDYFGTDFFHIYVGNWARDRAPGREFTTPDSTPVLETAAYVSDKANIVANAYRFRRFAIDCYGYTQEWEQYPLAPHGDLFANPVGPGTFNDYIRFLNFTNTNTSIASNLLIQTTCDDLTASLPDPGPSIRYVGTFNGVTADDLVTSIAAHYGFDPATGKDL